MGALLLLVPRGREATARDTALMTMTLRAAGSFVALSAVLLAAHATPPGPARTLDNRSTVQHFGAGMSIVAATARVLPGLPAGADLIGAVHLRGCQQLTFISRTLQPSLVIVEYRSLGPEYDGNAITSATTFSRSAGSPVPTTCLSDGPPA